MKMEKMIRIGKGQAEDVALLEVLDWPNISWLEIAQQLRNYFNLAHNTNEEDASKMQDEVLTPIQNWEMTIKMPLSIFKQAEKPRRIASLLGITRDKVYSLRRKLKKKAKKSAVQTLRMTSQQEIRKTATIEIIRDFIREYAHKFYTALYVRRWICNSKTIRKTPSLTTIRNLMKVDLKLAFKKVNLCFKAKWSPADLITKLKYL